MNLFQLFEGGVDDLEQRRIDLLNYKMDDLAARAKEATDPKHIAALRFEFAKHKAERDSYYRIKETAAVDEGWSDAMLAKRTDGKRTPFSVYINGKKWKDFTSDDHAQAVANKLRAKFRADGRDPQTITIAPTDMGPPPTVEQMTEDLRKWFKQKWVRFGPDGKIRGDCARGSEKEGKPKCLPQAKAHALGKKGRAAAGAKKRRQDPDADRKGKAINVATKKKKAKSK